VFSSCGVILSDVTYHSKTARLLEFLLKRLGEDMKPCLLIGKIFKLMLGYYRTVS
jgi:hypothetical protein